MVLIVDPDLEYLQLLQCKQLLSKDTKHMRVVHMQAHESCPHALPHFL